ncbi:MAG: CaiB/BaiF CoA-transferase family protein [Actinomycetota bacterium]|nr:CaiB/BaiF CoA-transferase family protein [Actinomycetota bacterium]
MEHADDAREPARGRGRPLEGITVLDFSQFLAGPVAALRLSDLGARVIKVERPVVGELGRTLAFAELRRDGDSLTFHAMNRGKESLAADLKSSEDLEVVRQMVRSADVIVENFRPGVMRRIGLDYESVREINPGIVYGSISGYGASGPWADKPGQDLLAQSRSGLPWLNGDRSSPPVPVGLSIADHLASCQLAIGIAALLVRRERTGEGGIVETSLLEGVLDFQFELLTAYFNEPAFALRRSGVHGANAYLSAPYGVYPTADGYLALAMYPVPRIGELLELPELQSCTDPETWMTDRDRIATLLGERLACETTGHWLGILEPADVWCAPVLTLPELAGSEGFAAIEMLQEVTRQTSAGTAEVSLTTTRSPLRVDGERLVGGPGAPHVGEHSEALRREFGATARRADGEAASR